jgi:predicted N-acetyltransferase YhbS
MSEITISIRDESEVTPTERQALGVLLATTWPKYADKYSRLAWRSIPPTFRSIAFDGDKIVGQQSVFTVRTDPQLAIYGLGDVAVLPEYRKQGIARRLIVAACEEGRRRGTEFIFTGTEVLWDLFIDLGFRENDAQTCYRIVDGKKDVVPWLLWEKPDSSLPKPFQVIDSDF